MVAEAVNVTLVPKQIEFVDGTIVSEMGTVGFTVIAIGLETVIIGDAQEMLLLISHVTISPVDNAALEKVGLFVPVFAPFTFH